MRYRVDIFLDGVWRVCQLAKLAAQLEPGSFGTFPDREMAEKFIQDWPRRECQKEQLRVVEVEK